MRRSIVSLLLPLVALACACTARGATQGASGEGPEAAFATDSTSCTSATMDAPRCRDMRAAVVDAAGERDAVIGRALDWIDDGVSFDRAHVHQGYRADCSGFVSMAWGLSAEMSDGNESPDALAASHPAGALDDAKPGDALARGGHLMILGAWADAKHESAIVLEQTHDGLASMRTVGRDSLTGFSALASR